MNGVISATLARNDFVGSTESVEGKHMGFWSATATTRIRTRPPPASAAPMKR